MIRFCFSHIPKCGGTHVRLLLKQAYGESCFPNIIEVIKSQHKLAHLIRNKYIAQGEWPDLSGDNSWIGATGHYGPHELLDLFNLDVPVFTWIRDPMTRRLSSVFHKARYEQVGSRPIVDDLWSNKEEQVFIRKRFLEEDDGLYSKLWGGQEHRAAFVGRMEHFEEDWIRCVKFFDFHKATLEGIGAIHNENPMKNAARYGELLDLLYLSREIACRENPVFEKEYEVYEKLLAKALDPR